MVDLTTERIINLQNRFRIRLAELGFGGVQASNVVHSLAGISVLAQDVATDSVPLFLALSPKHKESFVKVPGQLKG